MSELTDGDKRTLGAVKNTILAACKAPTRRRVFNERPRGEPRPSIPYGDVWCNVCNAACDFDEGALNNYFGKPDKAGNHRGYLVIRAYCHGQHADVSLTFEQARDHNGKRIVAFDNLALEQPAPELKDVTPLLEYRQASKKE